MNSLIKLRTRSKICYKTVKREYLNLIDENNLRNTMTSHPKLENPSISVQSMKLKGFCIVKIVN